MGRPLNKKYFGNRNVGSSSASDDGIGGKSVASIAITTAGSYTTRPTITLTGAPDMVKGVAATATITSEASTGAVTTAGTGYVAGDLLSLTSAGGSAIAYVATVNGSGAITAVNFTGTGASRGSFEALPGAKIAAVGGTGAGAEITITFRAKVVVINPGSGYNATTPTASVSGGGVVLGTLAMTTPVGNTNPAGSGLNPFPAIIARAYTGSSSKQADIIKQVSTYRYKVVTTDTTVIAKLKTSGAASALGEMTIKATDSDGGTYWVKKLTARKAVIVPNTGTQFPANADGTYKVVRWTLDSPTANTTVQIENA